MSGLVTIRGCLDDRAKRLELTHSSSSSHCFILHESVDWVNCKRTFCQGWEIMNHSFLAQFRVGFDKSENIKPVLESEIVTELRCCAFGWGFRSVLCMFPLCTRFASIWSRLVLRLSNKMNWHGGSVKEQPYIFDRRHHCTMGRQQVNDAWLD